MHTIIELLNEKNFCLEKFIGVNATELSNFTSGNFDNLEEFYATREGLLEIIKKIDFLIDEKNQDPVDTAKISVEFKRDILDAQRTKNDLVGQILQQDLEILSALESAKSEIIRELSSVRSNKKAIGSYKSGLISTRLDEEA
ncbi:MAG: hypothetical protein AABZ31_00755 [Bdellovibrionota bacterium]